MPKTYRNRQIIRAQQYTGENFSDLKQWAPVEQHEGQVNIYLRIGVYALFFVQIGDWIVQDPMDDFSVVSDGSFGKLYEEVQ